MWYIHTCIIQCVGICVYGCPAQQVPSLALKQACCYYHVRWGASLVCHTYVYSGTCNTVKHYNCLFVCLSVRLSVCVCLHDRFCLLCRQAQADPSEAFCQICVCLPVCLSPVYAVQAPDASVVGASRCFFLSACLSVCSGLKSTVRVCCAGSHSGGDG